MKDHTISYSDALRTLKVGRRIARQNWNGKGMFVYLNRGSAPEEAKLNQFINGVPSYMFETGARDTVIRMPCINMKAADGSTVVGWLASQTDQLAEDWIVLPEPIDTDSDEESEQLLEKLNA